MFNLTTRVMSSIDTRQPMPPMSYSAARIEPTIKPNTPVPIRNDVQMSQADTENNDLPANYKPLDVNRYATKKTIAQGMLDIALLTANASQLKYVLTIGHQHQFYTLMISLITLSIILQILQALVSLLLGSAYNINKPRDQRSANAWNNFSLTLIILTVAVNVIISAFDMRESDSHGVRRNLTTTANQTSFLAGLFG